MAPPGLNIEEIHFKKYWVSPHKQCALLAFNLYKWTPCITHTRVQLNKHALSVVILKKDIAQRNG